MKTAGMLAAAVPLVQIAGCADESESPQVPAADPSAASPANPEPAPSSSRSGAVQEPAATVTRLEETAPMAEALGYRHLASDVDGSRFPRYQPGQACANCSLYQADATQDPGWGGCAIFPNRLVDARGWCNAYVPLA